MIGAAAAGAAARPQGSIGGVVLNATRGNAPVPQADVVLRIRAEGQLALFRETKSDAEGRFFFAHLPVGSAYPYLPGANRDGIHYPGPAMLLTAERPHAIVELTVSDAVAEPCPLVIRRQRVSLHPEPGVLRVDESLLVDNPSTGCYVGAAGPGHAPPVTLRLAIPADFVRITFGDDFFGPRFSLVDGKLVTSVPWTPGRRELKFSYVLRNNQRSCVWERSLDLPCDDLRVEVQADNPNEIVCNLPKSLARSEGQVAFQSAAATLPAGQPIRVQLGQLPVPWADYARWLSPLVLLGVVALASYFLFCRPTEDLRSLPAPIASADACRESPAAAERRNKAA
jgi:hypothetical protein